MDILDTAALAAAGYTEAQIAKEVAYVAYVARENAAIRAAARGDAE